MEPVFTQEEGFMAQITTIKCKSLIYGISNELHKFVLNEDKKKKGQKFFYHLCKLFTLDDHLTIKFQSTGQWKGTANKFYTGDESKIFINTDFVLGKNLSLSSCVLIAFIDYLYIFEYPNVGEFSSYKEIYRYELTTPIDKHIKKETRYKFISLALIILLLYKAKVIEEFDFQELSEFEFYNQNIINPDFKVIFNELKENIYEKNKSTFDKIFYLIFPSFEEINNFRKFQSFMEYAQSHSFKRLNKYQFFLTVEDLESRNVFNELKQS